MFYESSRFVTRKFWRILLSFGEHLFQGNISSGCFQKIRYVKRNKEDDVKASKL